MAVFCLAAEMAPSEYRQLTRLERAEFWELLEQQAKRARRK